MSQTIESIISNVNNIIEIIIVDNNSSDNTKSVCDYAITKYPDKIKYLFEPIQGLSHARNAGIVNSTGEIIVFIDDDVEVTEKWLDSIVAEFIDTNVACVGGPVRPIWIAERPEWLTDQWCGWLTLHEFEWAKESRELKGPCYPVGANIAFRKDVFKKVGLFSTELGRVGNCLLSNEESRICTAIEEIGLRIRLAPEAIVYHKIPPERLEKTFFYKRMYWQGVSDAIMDGLLNIGSFNLAQKIVESVIKIARSEQNSFSQRCNIKYLTGYFHGLSDNVNINTRKLVVPRVLKLILSIITELPKETNHVICRDVSSKVSAADKEIENIRNSLSWRITAPLRFIGDLLRKNKH